MRCTYTHVSHVIRELEVSNLRTIADIADSPFLGTHFGQLTGKWPVERGGFAVSTVSAESRPATPSRPGFIVRIPTDDTLPRWRAWVARHPIAGSLLAGVVATQFATVFG